MKEEAGKIPSSKEIQKLRDLLNRTEQHLNLKAKIAAEIRNEADKIKLPFDPIRETEKITEFASDLQSRFNKSETENKEAAKRVKSLVQSIGALKGQTKELSGNIKILQGRGECPTCLRPLTDENLDKVMERIKSKIHEIKQRIQKLEEERKKTEKRQEETSQQLRQMEKQKIILETINEKCNSYSQEEKSANTSLQKAREILKRLGYSKIEEMLATFNARNLDELIEKKGKVTAQLKAKMKEIKSLNKRMEKAEKRLSQEQKQIQKLKYKHEKLNVQIDNSREKLLQILHPLKVESIESLLETFEKKTLDDLITNRKIREIELKGRREKRREIEKQIKENKQKYQKIKTELKELQSKLEILIDGKKELTHIERLRILVDDFISEHVVRNRLCGALKTATTNYLTCFSTGRYSLQDIDAPTRGPYGAGVTITLKDHVDQLEKTRELLSGGDKACLGLALRMAISNLMSRIRPFKSERLKRPKVRCLIMDEPLGSLDSKRRPEVVRTLIGDTAFKQIFLITHTNVLLSEDELLAAHKIRVYQEAGISRITFQPALTS